MAALVAITPWLCKGASLGKVVLVANAFARLQSLMEAHKFHRHFSPILATTFALAFGLWLCSSLRNSNAIFLDWR